MCPSTRASFHCILDFSSWTITTSPTLITSFLSPETFLNFLKDVRYSVFQWFQNFSITIVCLLIFSLIALPLTEVGSSSSSLFRAWGTWCILLSNNKWEGVSGCGLDKSGDTYIGRQPVIQHGLKFCNNGLKLLECDKCSSQCLLDGLFCQKPLYHGAHLGISCQVTLWCASSLYNVSDVNNLCRPQLLLGMLTHYQKLYGWQELLVGESSEG